MSCKRSFSTRTLIVLTLCAGLSASSSFGQTAWYVDDDAPHDPGPGDSAVSDPDEDGSAAHPFDAIQEAIDVAGVGDEVIVADGMYAGAGNKNLDYDGKALVVRSENGAESCTIDCESNGRGFRFESGATRDAVVDGFTIINGDAELGAGVFCASYCSPTIRNCVITGGSGIVGGGIYCHGYCSPAVSNCVISDNAVAGEGAGISCRSTSSPEITNCTIVRNISNNFGGGIYCSANSLPTVANCVISDNTAKKGGAVYCGGGESDMTLTNCLIERNAADQFTCGVIQVASDSNITIDNCTLRRNMGKGGEPGITVKCADSSVTITNSIIWQSFSANFGLYGDSSLTVSYSNIQGGAETAWCLDPNACVVTWGPGNIDADPCFVHADAHLLSESPCIDAGDPNGDYTGRYDLDGEERAAHGRVDIGADEFLDADADSLPNRWEQLHFASPIAGDPAVDHDSDDLTNLDEYARHRDPFTPPTTYYVDAGGDDAWDGLAPEWDGDHGPKAAIQSALDAADYYEEDQVLVADGVYSGHAGGGLTFRGRTLALRSMNGPDNCIIDCDHAARGFLFTKQESPHSIVDGFTILDGYNGYGGGVLCRKFTSPTFTNCRFAGCRSATRGGAVCSMDDSNLALTNCLIVGNRAPNPSFNSGIGGGVCCINSGVTIVNCTIVGNTAGCRGGAIDLFGLCPATIANTIMWGNTAEDRPGVGSLIYGVVESPVGRCAPLLTVSHSDIQGADPNQLVEWGLGNFNSNPLFADADGSDDDPNTWIDNDYRLSPTSACIDAGDNAAVPTDSHDLDGRLRFADRIDTLDTGLAHPDYPNLPIVDMGAYEHQCSGDLNGDGGIDVSDINILLCNYNLPGGYEDGDVRGDGVVDLCDLAYLLAAYGTTCD